VQLTKHQGLGNDFLVRRTPDLPAGAPALARRLCARRRGVGADGLIFGVDPADPANDVAMVLFNADGSRAEMSGNGIRCLAQAVLAGPAPRAVNVETDAGVRQVLLTPTDEPSTVQAAVDMGRVGPGPGTASVRLASGEIRSATADIGNPHLVVQVEDPAAVELSVAGPRHEAVFAAGINVEFIAPADGSAIDLRVWERGAGVTEACGSGACAAAYHAREWGLVGEQVEVRMPGGSAQVGLGDTVTLSGPAVHVATIEVPDE
jgi:diaminopimelate epimerase